MKIFGVELRFNGFRIYHEGDKPTPSEIGAAASNHTHTTMGAASASVAGKAGLVPAPPAGKQGQFLRGDATWAVPYTHPTTSGNKHIPSGGAAGQVLGYAAAGTAAWKTLNASDVGAAASSHTHAAMKAATASAAGKSGMVPVPVAGAQAKYLRGDGTWATPPTSSYTHPTTAGYKHIPAGGESGQVLGYSEDGTAAWTTLTASDVGAAPSSHTHDDRYYTETEVKNLIDATFLTKTFTGAKVSIAGKTAKAITITCATPSGYTAIGVIGYYTGSTYVLPCRVAKGRMDVYNTDSNAISVTPTITMLYAKSGAV